MKAKVYNQVIDNLKGRIGLIEGELLTDRERERVLKNTPWPWRMSVTFRRVRVADGKIYFGFGARFAVNENMIEEII